MQYNWQQKDWPRFTYDLTVIESLLLQYLEKTAHLSGILKALPARIKSNYSCPNNAIEPRANKINKGALKQQLNFA